MPPEQLGPYRIGSRLGRGGMGAVYEAIDSATGAPVAVKVLAAHLADDVGLRARFRAEIDTLKELRHPGIVQLLAFGEDDDQPYFAMELVRGRTLEQEIRSGRRFTWRETVATALAVTRALKVAHDHGVIHRDLKPSNLLLVDGLPPGEAVKLADFGIAKLFGGAAHTAQGNIVGTAEYMAPEQAAGQGIDHRADLYALGLVMYAMLAGRPPFRGGQVTEVIEKQRNALPPRLSTVADGVPPELDTLVDRLLSKDPAARPASALALARLLTAIDTLVPETPPAAGPEKLVITDLADAASVRPEQDMPTGDRTTVVGRSSGVVGAHPAGDTPAGPVAGPSYGAPTAAPTAATRGPSSAGPTGQDQPPIDLPTVPAKRDAPAGRTAGIRDAVTDLPPDQAAATTRVGTGVRRRHTSVADLERADRERRQREGQRQIWWQATLALAIAGAVLAGGWFLLRPPSADLLWARIQDVAADPSGDLRDADDALRQFLARHPDDPRAEEARALERRMAIERLERRARRRPRSDALLDPLERDYRAAMAREQESPAACLAALEALVALHPVAAAGTVDPAPAIDDALWLELARRQIARLEPLAHQERQQDLQRIAETLELASSLRERALAAASPAERDAMLAQRTTLLESLVATYGGRPHAEEALDTVAELLARAEAPLADPAAPPTDTPPSTEPPGADPR